MDNNQIVCMGGRTTMDESTAIYLLFGMAGQHGGYLVMPSSGLSKPRSALKHVGERLGNVSR